MSFSIPPPLFEEQARHAQDDLKRSRRGRRWLWVFLVTSLSFNLMVFAIFLFRHKPGKTSSHSVFEERYLSGERDSENKIAVIRLVGIISSETDSHVGHDGMVGDIKEQLRLAEGDKAVKAIILRIDSPGGEVLASDEIYRAVCAARKQKPIICSMGSLAASGGYYAALGSSYIIADDLTITGSIGVIMQTLNYKDLFGKIGLKSMVYKSGKFKDLLNGGRDPTLEEESLVQNLIMEVYEQFLQVVATERKLDAQMLRENIADGRIFSGKQALTAKLIDRTGVFQDAISEAKRRAKISEAEVLDYEVPFSLSNLFGLFGESHTKKIQLEISPQPISLQQGKLYYLSFHLF